jgi:HK97 family phage major capsid protein
MRPVHIERPALGRQRGHLSTVFAQPRDPAATILAELQSNFGEWQARHDERLGAVEAALNDALASQTAARLNGGDPAADRRNARPAVESMGAFARSGVTAWPADAQAGLNPQAGMSSDNDPSGGYLVPTEVAREIYLRQRDIGVIRQLARVVPTVRNDYQLPRSEGGTASGWVAERQARSKTGGPGLSMITFPAGEIYAEPAVTQRLLDDSDFNVGDFLTGEIAREFEEKESAAFVSGDGIDKPRGFLTHDVYARGVGDPAQPNKIQYIASGGSAGFASSAPHNAFVTMLYALKAGHRRNSTWVMNSRTAGSVMMFRDGQDRPIWIDGLAFGQPATLLGRPVEIDENMPDVGGGAFPIALANWQAGYLINDRMGMRILRDPLTDKPNVLFYATKRVGGGVADAEAIKLMKIADE